MAAGGRSRRRGARSTAVSGGADQPGACPPRPRRDPPGAQGRRGDAAPAVGGVPAGPRRERLRLQPVLRAVSPVGWAASAVDAAGAPCGREALCGLLGQAAIDRGRQDGRAGRGRALRGGTGGERLHVRGGDGDAEASRVARCARADARVLRGLGGDLGAGPAQGRDQRVVPVRAWGQPDVPGAGEPLRGGGDPGTASQAAGQGEGRGGGAPRSAVDPGAAAQAELLRSRRAQRGDPGARRRAERSADAEAEGQPPGAVGAGGSSSAQGAACDAVRGVAVDPVPGEHRLPRRGRRPPLTACRTSS